MTAFSTTTLLSTAQWLDNYLLQKGQMYTNTTTRLYYQADPSMPGYSCYAAPFRSMVWDSGVSGATVIGSISGYPSGPNGSYAEISRGQSGMMVDFVNGRVIFPSSSIGSSAIISGSYSFKDFNIYFANQGANRMVFSDKYYLNSRFGNPVTGVPPANTMVTPCIFISAPRITKPVIGLGGYYKSQVTIELNVLAETQGQLENALSLLACSRDLTFPQLPASSWPLGPLGDFKSGYSYPNVRSEYAGGPFYWITAATASKISDSVQADQSLFMGQVSLTVEAPRRT